MALLEAEEAELAADLVAVLMELAALDAAPVAELCLLEATEDIEPYDESQTDPVVYRAEIWLTEAEVMAAEPLDETEEATDEI